MRNAAGASVSCRRYACGEIPKSTLQDNPVALENSRPPHTPNAHVPTARAPASTQPTIHACARPTGARWAFDAPPSLHPRTQRGGPARQVKVRRSIAAHSTDANALTQWASVASPIICRSALAIEAQRGVASLANTARYGLRDAPCAALRWLRAAYDI